MKTLKQLNKKMTKGTACNFKLFLPRVMAEQSRTVDPHKSVVWEGMENCQSKKLKGPTLDCVSLTFNRGRDFLVTMSPSTLSIFSGGNFQGQHLRPPPLFK